MRAAGVGDPEGAEVSFLKKPILVLWEARTRALSCVMLRTQALSDPYAVQAAARTVDTEWGYAGEQVVLRGDGEPALQALRTEIAAKRRGTAPIEGSPPGDHQANGAAEQGVRLAQGAARTLLARVAQALGLEDVPETSPLSRTRCGTGPGSTPGSTCGRCGAPAGT